MSEGDRVRERDEDGLLGGALVGVRVRVRVRVRVGVRVRVRVRVRVGVGVGVRVRVGVGVGVRVTVTVEVRVRVGLLGGAPMRILPCSARTMYCASFSCAETSICLTLSFLRV